MTECARQIRLLVVGTLPPPICGTTVSLKLLCDWIESADRVEAKVLDTGSIRDNGLKGIILYFRLLVNMFLAARHTDVITLHLNPWAVSFVGPFAILCRCLFGCKVMLRVFGGMCFTEFGGLNGFLFRWCVQHSDLYLAQTKSRITSAKAEGVGHVKWMPTSRPTAGEAVSNETSRQCRKFISVGWVCEAKGAKESIVAIEKCKLQVSVDFYGPLWDMSVEDFSGLKRCCYKGIIPVGETVTVMAEYDALLFPTHWSGEGYPGVILEAFQAGIPVVTSNWRSIPEIVDESCGLLVPPFDLAALETAIERLARDEKFYMRLKKGAKEKSNQFSAETWNATLIDYCYSLIR